MRRSASVCRLPRSSALRYDEARFFRRGIAMTTVRITLPDELAKQAEAAGLLASDMIGRMIEEALRIQAGR